METQIEQPRHSQPQLSKRKVRVKQNVLNNVIYLNGLYKGGTTHLYRSAHESTRIEILSVVQKHLS